MKAHIITILFVYLLTLNLHAEVITDGTLGSRVNLPGNDFNFKITTDLGQQHGGNLFHSFQEFNLKNGETAIFLGANNINNIISRVTGGNRSEIDGIIHSTVNADMYFLNPNGIIFGPNAALNLQGSFYASTADYLNLGEKGRFDVQQPKESILTVASPSAFGFLGGQIGSVEVNHSVLAIPESKTLGLIGGDITIKAMKTIKRWKSSIKLI